MIIRSATRADEPGIQRAIRACYDEYEFSWDPDGYMADIYDLKAHYFDHGDGFFVAEAEGEILGSAALEVFVRVPGNPGDVTIVDGKVRVCAADCSLERLYVHPDHRRKGVGIALLVHVLGEARRLGKTNLELWSDKKLTKAHALYEKYGAINVGERICDDPDESPEWGMLIAL